MSDITRDELADEIRREFNVKLLDIGHVEALHVVWPHIEKARAERDTACKGLGASLMDIAAERDALQAQVDAVKALYEGEVGDIYVSAGAIRAALGVTDNKATT